MSIKELPEWAINQNHPAFYDTESKTAIEMSAQLHGKMNEVIQELNDFTKDTQDFMDTLTLENKDWKETTATGIRQEFQDFIDVVDIKVQGANQALEETNERMDTIERDVDNKLADINASYKKVLFDNPNNTVSSIFLSEAPSNFDFFEIYFTCTSPNINGSGICTFGNGRIGGLLYGYDTSGKDVLTTCSCDIDNLKLSVTTSMYYVGRGITLSFDIVTNIGYPTKVIGYKHLTK